MTTSVQPVTTGCPAIVSFVLQRFAFLQFLFRRHGRRIVVAEGRTQNRGVVQVLGHVQGDSLRLVVKINLPDATGRFAGKTQTYLVISLERHRRQLERKVVVAEKVHFISLIA